MTAEASGRKFTSRCDMPPVGVVWTVGDETVMRRDWLKESANRRRRHDDVVRLTSPIRSALELKS